MKGCALLVWGRLVKKLRQRRYFLPHDTTKMNKIAPSNTYRYVDVADPEKSSTVVWLKRGWREVRRGSLTGVALTDPALWPSLTAWLEGRDTEGCLTNGEGVVIPYAARLLKRTEGGAWPACVATAIRTVNDARVAMDTRTKVAAAEMSMLAKMIRKCEASIAFCQRAIDYDTGRGVTPRPLFAHLLAQKVSARDSYLARIAGLRRDATVAAREGTATWKRLLREVHGAVRMEWALPASDRRWSAPVAPVTPVTPAPAPMAKTGEEFTTYAKALLDRVDLAPSGTLERARAYFDVLRYAYDHVDIVKQFSKLSTMVLLRAEDFLAHPCVEHFSVEEVSIVRALRILLQTTK